MIEILINNAIKQFNKLKSGELDNDLKYYLYGINQSFMNLGVINIDQYQNNAKILTQEEREKLLEKIKKLS